MSFPLVTDSKGVWRGYKINDVYKRQKQSLKLTETCAQNKQDRTS